MQETVFQEIQDRIQSGGRISDEEFLLLDREADLYQLGFLANSIRERLHPEKRVTYVIDRNINYTDICISACKFCAFFKAPEDREGYLAMLEALDGDPGQAIRHSSQVFLDIEKTFYLPVDEVESEIA